MKQVEIFDSMLRDGAQGESISFSVRDKLEIVKALDEFGVDYIEAGNPGSNPKDLEFFARASELQLTNARLCAFGSTCRKGAAPQDDSNILSLLQAETPTVAIFGKAWALHVSKVLNTTEDENLRLVADTVRFLKENGKEVVFDAEHFFDGYIDRPAFALRVLQSANDAGADVLCLCDTNGGTLPSKLQAIVAEVAEQFPDQRIGIHCHNDAGFATASSLMAVEAGVTHVQGTFIGIGERCGNADLSSILPSLRLKMERSCKGNLSLLRHTSNKLYALCNLHAPLNKPYVGASAFAHKGGMHVDGVTKIARSFEHVTPETVGNQRRFLMSEVSGRTMVLAKIASIAPQLNKQSPEVAEIVQMVKNLEQEGYQFESADASFELLVLRHLGQYIPHFSLNMYRTSGENPFPTENGSASAMLSIQVGDQEETTAATGNGPVHALDTALRKALTVFYPQLSNMRLTDYKVRVLSGNAATASCVRVLIESTNTTGSWTTIGVSSDIIAASWQALCDSFEYYLHVKEVTEPCQ